jgi:capsular polysaccharide transport system ATP-binding protein
MNPSSFAKADPGAPLIELSNAFKVDSSQVNMAAGDEPRLLLDNVSLSVYKGDRIGVFTPNAAESTALINCLAGVSSLDKGELLHHANISWPLGANEALDAKLSGFANASFAAEIYERPENVLDKIELIQELAELDDSQYHSPLVSYSGKQKQSFRLALSLAFDFDCYLIGRVGDWRRKVGERRTPAPAFRYMKEKLDGKTLVISSANQVILAMRYCTTGITLIDGKIVHRGDPADCLELVKDYRRAQMQRQMDAISSPDVDELSSPIDDFPVETGNLQAE